MDIKKLEKDIALAYEKQIARTVLLAQKIHEESYELPEGATDAITYKMGEYTTDLETCFIKAAKKNNLSPSMWYLLSLANYWHNDIQEWAENIIAGKDCYINEPCLKDSSIEKCEQCKEICFLANLKVDDVPYCEKTKAEIKRDVFMEETM